MGEAIGETFKVASDIVDAFLKTHEEPIPDPVEMIRRLAEVRQFSQKFTDETVSSYLTEPDASRFGVINAFTRAAQGLGPLQRIEVERFAGVLLEAPLHDYYPLQDMSKSGRSITTSKELAVVNS
jgi:hypothetical protein